MDNVLRVLLLLFANVSNYSFSQNIVPADLNLQLNRNDFLQINFPLMTNAGIYNIEPFTNGESVTLTFYGMISDSSGGQYFSIGIYEEQTVSLHIKSRGISTIDYHSLNRPLDLISPTLIHDASSILNDNKQIQLSNAVYQFQDMFCEFRLYNKWCTIKRDLRTFVLSPSKKYIVGYLGNTVSSGNARSSFSTFWYTAGIWDSQTGNNLFLEDPAYASIDRGEPMSFAFDIAFSPSNRFVIFRQAKGYLSLPYSVLVDTKTFQEWQADKDVAFTSDSRFFVTERGGAPTLVDAQHNRNLQTYDVGESIMHAATFSEDGETLYIATGDDKIYVFPSQLPTSHVEGWESYAK